MGSSRDFFYFQVDSPLHGKILASHGITGGVLLQKTKIMSWLHCWLFKLLHPAHERYSEMSDLVIPRRSSPFWLHYYPSDVGAPSPVHEPFDRVSRSPAFLLFVLLFSQNPFPWTTLSTNPWSCKWIFSGASPTRILEMKQISGSWANNQYWLVRFLNESVMQHQIIAPLPKKRWNNVLGWTYDEVTVDEVPSGRGNGKSFLALAALLKWAWLKGLSPWTLSRNEFRSHKWLAAGGESLISITN